MAKKKKVAKKKVASKSKKRKPAPARKKAKPAAKKKKAVVKKKAVKTKPSPKVKLLKKPVQKVLVGRKPAPVPLKPVPKPAPVTIPPTIKPAPRSKKPVIPATPPPPPPPPLKKIITIVRSSEDKKRPEPPGKYVLEYIIHSPLSIIFEMISSPSGLCEWFADDVTVKEGAFIFYWDGLPNPAKMVNYKDDRLVRFEWEGKNDGRYFEFRLQTDELTNEVSLFVTDFMEDGSDLTAARLLWDKQISNLKHVLGS